MASFMKKGKAAQTMHKKADAEAEAKKAASENKVNRFWMPQDTEGQITFLDGDVDAEGVLNANSYWEHQLKLNGHFRNWFPCTQLEEVCPICEGGEQAALVTVFTVIDHKPYTDKNGKEHKNQKRLFACKREVYRRLQKLAAKHKGLKGITFDVSRGGDKSPNCGDTFDFAEKRSVVDLAKALGMKSADLAPLDYDELIVYRDAKALRKMGFGAEGGNKAIGSGDGDEVADTGGGDVGDYDDEV